MKKPGGRNRRANNPSLLSRLDWESLEHTEHDGADERKGDIRGNNAQSADESHGKTPLVHVVPAINDLG